MSEEEGTTRWYHIIISIIVKAAGWAVYNTQTTIHGTEMYGTYSI